MTKVLIVGNARHEKLSKWTNMIERSDIIIACDGAVEDCVDQGIRVDYLIGDMDSVTQEMLEYAKNNSIEIVEILSQENNDLTKAIHFAHDLNPATIDIIGVDGGCSDHQFCNYLSLIECQTNARIYLDDCTVSAITNNCEVCYSIEIGTIFSLFSVGTSSGVNLTGAKWVLKDSKLTPSSTGLHNVATSDQLVVSCQSGNLLLFVNH